MSSSDSSVEDRWSKDLPHELVDMIVKGLGLFDFISLCYAVCSSSWTSFENQFPCILQSLPYQDYSAGTLCYSLYSPAEDRARSLKFPKGDVHGDAGTAPYCSGAFGSWLIFAQHSLQHPKTAESYFFNPVSGARIPLPPHSDPSFFVRDDRTRRDEIVFVKTVASSDPTDPNCIVAALTLHGHRLAFCRPNDASWTLQYDTPIEGGYGLTDLHFHDGELYATVGRKMDAVLTFDPIEVLSQSQSRPSDKASAFTGKMLWAGSFEDHTRYMHDPSFTFVTSSSGELLLVFKDERRWKSDREEVLLLVLRCKVDKSRLKYEEVNDIGEQAIFLGNIGVRTLTAMAKPTNSMPVIDKRGSGNCIYFTNEKDDRIGVYNLADRTLRYPLTGDLQQTHSKVWFTPKLS